MVVSWTQAQTGSLTIQTSKDNASFMRQLHEVDLIAHMHNANPVREHSTKAGNGRPRGAEAPIPLAVVIENKHATLLYQRKAKNCVLESWTSTMVTVNVHKVECWDSGKPGRTIVDNGQGQ